MSQRLKRWESPRKQGRNDKGRGGSARKRQLDKRERMLRQKLKDGSKDNNTKDRQQHQKSKKGEDRNPLLFYLSPTSKISDGASPCQITHPRIDFIPTKFAVRIGSWVLAVSSQLRSYKNLKADR
jgi:hypothetical protein